MNKNNTRKLTTNDTNIIKGFSIILLIVHHLFWNTPNYGLMIGEFALSQRIALIGKVCVSIFLILSGFGLQESAKKEFEVKSFYAKRFFKLYLNYSILVLFSLTIGKAFFPLKLTAMMGDHPVLEVLSSLSGLQYFFDYNGLNASWWFISVILFFYLLYPLIKNLLHKFPHQTVLISSLFLFSNLLPFNLANLNFILIWLPAFVWGAYLSEIEFFPKLNTYFKNHKILKFLSLTCALFLLGGLLYYRQTIFDADSLNGIRIDLLLSFFIISFLFLLSPLLGFLGNGLQFLGKHSLTIYLTHMFLTTYYTKNFIYSLKSPLLMTAIVLALSLLWALIYEKILKFIGVESLIKSVLDWIESKKIK